jgi:tetratricopeptide (TPR) repeat protein
MSADTPTTVAAAPPAGPGDAGLAHQWQIPLLLIAVPLFIWSLLHLRPEPTPPTFGDQVDHLERLLRGRLYEPAVVDAEALLKAADRSPLESARLQCIIAEAVYQAESPRSTHNPENAERIIRNYLRAEENGLTLSGKAHQQAAAAWEWLGNSEQALDEYSLAMLSGPQDFFKVQRRIMHLKNKLGLLPEQEHLRLLEGYLARAGENPGELIWALGEKIDLLSERGDVAGARRLLAEHGPALVGRPEHRRVEFLDALLLFREGRYDDAERALRALRAKLELRDEIYAQATCLLGRLNLQDGRPYEALTFFNDVLDSYTSGPFLAASLLGAAETEASLRRFGVSAEHYRQLIDMLPFRFESNLINEEIIRSSLTALYESLRQRGDLTEALTFIELATKFIDEADEKTQAVYLVRLADAHAALGEQYKNQARSLGQSGTEREGVQPDRDLVEPETGAAGADPAGLSREHFIGAAETYLMLAERQANKEGLATGALWKASEYYDKAGETAKVVDVLLEFTSSHRISPLMPDALLRLGRSYQALGQLEQAAEVYRENITDFTRTPAALDSVVPLARCYLSMGEEHFDQAEKVLISLLDQSDRKEALVTPGARQYRQALFLLGDMYVQAKEYEKAITALEESLARYPNDPGALSAKFVLADSYRLSGLALKAQAERPDSGPARPHLTNEYQRRLRRAHDLFGEVVKSLLADETGAGRPQGTEYLRLGMFYQADCLFDIGAYEQALPLYEEVSWRFHDSPSALSAYVQIINCYQRLGRPDEATAALSPNNWWAGFHARTSNVWSAGWARPSGKST